MADVDRFSITDHGSWVRANVWTDRGASSKSCLNWEEAFAFINQVKSQRTWVRSKQ
jgi:hypothetical protein